MMGPERQCRFSVPEKDGFMIGIAMYQTGKISGIAVKVKAG